MELGFARFLEMFEERFGRFVTTLLMGALAVAAGAWAIQTTVEATVYVYGLVKAADFIGALKTERAATHLVVFAIQIIVTFVILGLLWRLFLQRKITALETKTVEWETRIAKKLNDAEERADEAEARFEEGEARLNQRSQELMERMAAIKSRQERILAERKDLRERLEAKSPPEQPRPTPEPQDKPETK